MQVSPADSQTVMFGSRYDGLWISRTGGGNWVRSSLPSGSYGYGINFITFDSSNDGIFIIIMIIWFLIGDGSFCSDLCRS